MSHDQDTSKSRQFLHELAQFYQNRGQLGVTPKHLVARLDGRQVNLWELYSSVLELGGSFKVNQQSQWDTVYQKLFNRTPVGVNVSVALRQVYQRYLMPYERVNCTNFTTDIAEDDDDSIAARDQPTSFVLHSSLSQPISNQVNVNSFPNASSMLDPMTRLLCALGSGLANEIDFSLKIVTMLTNSRQITLVSDNRFVEALVNCSSVGACDCDEDDKCSCVRQFWSSKCNNGLVISLVFEDECIQEFDEQDNTGLPLYQQITSLSTEWNNQYSRRIKNIGDLIRRIVENIREDSQSPESLEEDIISSEPASLSLIKFTAQLLLSNDPEFISIGLDIMTNIELSPKSEEPYSELRRLICLQLASFVLDSLDIDLVTRSLDCLARLTQHSSEAFNRIAKDILSDKLLDRLIQLLTCQHDVNLVVASLEFCLAISQHHPKLLIQSNSYLVKILLNLVNCDASIHFSEYALKKIKVCDTRARTQPVRTIICQPQMPANRVVTNQVNQSVTITVPGDNEAFVVNWLRNCYEAGDSKSCIGVNDLYAEYVKYSLKNNRRNVVAVPVFSQIVLKTFPRVSFNGSRFDGLHSKPSSNSVHCKVFAPQLQPQQQTQTQTQAPTSTQGLISPILKAHLSTPPKNSPPVTAITSSTTCAPATTTSTLIKSLLATKLQNKSSLTLNSVGKDTSDDKADSANTATLTNAVVTTPILSNSPSVSSSNSQAVLISTPSVSAAGQPTQQLILVRTVIAPSHNNQGGNLVGVNQGQVRLILPASAFTQQRPTLIQPTVNGAVSNNVTFNHLASHSSTLSTVSISQSVTSTSNSSASNTSNDILMKAVLGSGISTENSKESAKSSVKSSPLLNVLLDKGKLPSDSQTVSSQLATVPHQMNPSQAPQQMMQQQTAATASTVSETPKMFILATKPAPPANQVINSVVRNGTKEKVSDPKILTNGDLVNDTVSIASGNNPNDSQSKNTKRPIEDINENSATSVDIATETPMKKTKVETIESEHNKSTFNGEVYASKSIEIEPEVPKVSDLPLPVTDNRSNPLTSTLPVTVASSTLSTETSSAVTATAPSSNNRPITQQVSLTPISLEFVCEWAGCLKKFTRAHQVFKHVYDDHVFASSTPSMMSCLWGSNEGTGPGCQSRRPRLSLLTHLQDFHCSANLLHQAAIRRQQMGPEVSVASTGPTVPPPPAHPGYAQNAALMAIRRHSVNYIEPVTGPVQNAFTPITVSIRLTAALILRNLADDSNEVRNLQVAPSTISHPVNLMMIAAFKMKRTIAHSTRHQVSTVAPSPLVKCFSMQMPLWLLITSLVLIVTLPPALGQFEWHTMDQFDQIRQTLDSVDSETCKIVDRNYLLLSAATVSHVPDLKTLGIDPIYPNRTNLLHVHNMALARAFYQSFILQKASDENEPGFMYLFLSAVSDVAANRFINASAIYYGPHMAFTPSYKGFYNKTMPLFAPRAYRTDDFNDPYHLQGTSTLNTIEVTDIGAVPNNSQSRNYTNDQYKINEWYSEWLPDQTKRQDTKETYQVRIAYANGVNESFTWHGPPAASNTPGPVKWVRPYFDCDRSNKWVYGATSPIVDIYPRHTGWRHIERPLFVAVSVMEMDFERIDINQCPIGEGNPSPNYFAGTARCKNHTTECEPIHGFGFRRGGYQCRCRPGYRLPRVAKTPFLGETVERATSSQYNREFECERIGYLGVRTQNVQKMSAFDRNMLLSRVQTLTGLDRNKSLSTDPAHIISMLRRPDINKETCRNLSASSLTLRGDIAFGKESQLENQARMALRLANFISAFLQLVDPKEQFAEFREPDKPLTEDQVIGEALAVVIGDRKILGCSVEFDRNRFTNRTVFAPLAFRRARNDREFQVIDQARPGPGNHDGTAYLKSSLFEHLKNRWATYTYDLPTFTAKINVRYNSSGLYAIKYDHYPLNYKAAELEHGYWTQPFYDCHGVHNQWILKYGVPFFGWDTIRSRLQFKGIVTVSVRLDELDINQCPDEYYVSNAFKNSHKCDRRSTRCVPILGRKFETGGYKCECQQGYEYPFNDPITYFDGQIMEAEYGNLQQDQPSRFDTLRCRIAGANIISSSPYQLTLFITLTIVIIIFLIG